ncbi:GGDEF domain-containing protein [Kineococcus radiotolerans]|uniref:Diguanylate cyclase n=1 Tax=Kineococcus radiotolerans (strain ATCC BAA-149 / DSM 14245 / SRS30216) TaxID=266940 RepID=A6WFI7_KINRD|nr:sensor domain-containing diguanylate cyclase [Kineococcus radiotolerans]ABS05576.1 diguanylate cyclase [Kineococcus radiotolerans SRS30216 = ATCC BAA-149]
MSPSPPPPPGPLAEAERLAAVSGAVRAGAADGGGDGLQRLVAMAARVLDVPVAMVSFITAEEEVIQAAVGLPEPWASLRTTPLSHSLCVQVVRGDGPVVLFDARQDPAYREHAAVLEMGAGAYAGYPLRHGEHVLGAFCAADFAPRSWSEDDLRLLEDLAAVVSTELTLRTTVQELEASRARLEDLTRRLHEQSRTDVLTGAANRRRVREVLADHVARLERHGGDLAMTLIDVDSFKRINDVAGHRTGDAVLTEIAARLQDTIRRPDLLARVGGDEFAVLLPDTDLAAAEHLARRLRHVVGDEPVAGWPVTVSTGTAVYDPDRGLEQLYADADAALYEAKGTRARDDDG